MGVPILGEGGLPTWEFFPLNTVLFLNGSLNDDEKFIFLLTNQSVAQFIVDAFDARLDQL